MFCILRFRACKLVAQAYLQDEITRIIRNPPQRILEADLDAMTATNPIADWLIECTEADPDAMVSNRR